MSVKVESKRPEEIPDYDEMVRGLEQFRRDLAFFESHYDDLVQRYPDEFVAIHGGNVLGHGMDLFALAERVHAGDKNTVVLRFASTKPLNLIL